MKKLSIIGCGKVGKTLASLWLRNNQFALGDILDISIEHASQATAFLGTGRAVSRFRELESVDAYLIATPDQAIAGCCNELAATATFRQDTLVFHCSGVTPSSVLAPAKSKGAAIASVHPIRSFADPGRAAATFAGTYCAIEGSDRALQLLRPALEAIGGIPFEIDPDHKAIYHAANVFVCNYLTTLIEIGVRTLEKTSLKHTTALEVIEPIVKGTVANIFELGTVQALTGPIARGDVDTVQHHLTALDAWDRPLAALYRALGSQTLELARQQESASPDQLAALSDLFEKGESWKNLS